MAKTIPLRAALCGLLVTAALMFVGLVVLHWGPQLPLALGCVVATAVALRHGWRLGDVCRGGMDGVKRSLEAMALLLCIGVLIAAWMASGTVPAMVVYGLELLSPRFFLPGAMLVCALLSMVLGSWGTAGTVGIAFMGMAGAMGIPAPMAAGAVISGAYVGDKLSPIADSTVLAATVAEIDVLSSIRNIAKVALPVFALCLVGFTALGWRYGGGTMTASPLPQALRSAFHLGPVVFLPLMVLVVCILCKLPAVVSMACGCLAGLLCAALVQGTSVIMLLQSIVFGYVGHTGQAEADALLTAGGLKSMVYTLSIVVLAMAYGGIMERTGQMETIVTPLTQRLQGFVPLMAAAVLTCIGTNVVLPDQYIAIALPGRMYAGAFRTAGMESRDLSLAVGVGGALTSALVPWNTCGVYMAGVLGIATAQYLPFCLYNLAMPIGAVLYAALRQQKRK